ncbi:aryl-alcohol dehydrogenase-like predicted oxidoreductase [Bradyrhizobium sp. GM24.11]
MEYRHLGASGLKVPVLSFGTGTFGGQGPLFSAWGRSGAEEARRLVDICLEGGANLFDSADVYSNGASEEILGAAIKGRRDKVLISTKMSLPMGDGPLDAGSSRHRLLASVEAALRRLGTDYIDLFQLHAFDAFTPIEEVLSTLDTLVRAGKLRYVGVSNFAGWQLMKSLAIADRHGWPRYVAHQVYYSLLGRDYEWELMPLARDQGVGALVWSPLGWGRLTGKIRRDRPLPQTSRLHATAQFGSARGRAAALRDCRCARCDCGRDRPYRAAGRHRLAAVTPHRLLGDHWRPRRGAVARQSRCGRLVAERGSAQAPRRGQRGDAALSLLSLSHPGRICAAEPAAGMSGGHRRHLVALAAPANAPCRNAAVQALLPSVTSAPQFQEMRRGEEGGDQEEKCCKERSEDHRQEEPRP